MRKKIFLTYTRGMNQIQLDFVKIVRTGRTFTALYTDWYWIGSLFWWKHTAYKYQPWRKTHNLGKAKP